MPVITQTASISTTIKHSIGLKAESLSMLRSSGLQVPSWIVISSNEFFEHIPQHILLQSPAEILEYIKMIQLDSSLLSQITSWISENNYTNAYFAVRSSVCDDNKENHLFSGQLKTSLYVPQNEVADAILACWASMFSPSVCAYRTQWGITPESIRLAVIIQKMIDPEVSGTAMNLNPHNGSRSTVSISSMYGINYGIGNSRIETDQYTIDFSGLRPSRVSKVYEKKYKTVFNQVAGSGITLSPLSYGMRSRSSLGSEQVLTIAEITRTLSSRQGKPQMIDWAISQGKLYILQSRTINALHSIPDTTDIKRKWIIPDMSFINNETVSPLSYSIIRKLTSKALCSFSKSSGGVSTSGMDPRQYDVLGNINGAIFIDQSLYLNILEKLPFFKNAKRDKKKNGFTDAAISHLRFVNDYLKIVKTAVSMTKKVRSCDLDRALDSTHCDKPFQLIEKIHSLDTRLESIWKYLVQCDYYITAVINLLQDQIVHPGRDQFEFIAYLYSQLSENCSFEQIISLTEITKEISKRPAIKELFFDCTINEIGEHLGLHSTLVPDSDEISGLLIRKLILDHISRFGNSGTRNLSFDTISQEQTIYSIIGLIRSYLTSGIASVKFDSTRNGHGHSLLDNVKLPLLHKFHYKALTLVIKKILNARKVFFAQQHTIFNALRTLFMVIGSRLYSEGIIENAEDIKYLTKEEIVDFVDGHSVTSGLNNLIALRKKELKLSRNGNTGANLETYGIVYHANDLDATIDSEMQSISLFQGVGNGSGIVCEKVKIGESPECISDIENSILVVRNCDPGWIPFLPLIKGLVIENGLICSDLVVACSKYDIPCVFSINGRINDLQNGSTIEVDSISGKISIIR